MGDYSEVFKIDLDGVPWLLLCLITSPRRLSTDGLAFSDSGWYLFMGVVMMMMN